jgi:hypothetical protein
MYHQGPNDQSRDYSSSSASSLERRSGERHPFITGADVTELASGSRFSTRTTDLGFGGCFVDTMMPFPVESRVHVTIKKGPVQFDADGTVVFAQVGLGMGIAFENVPGSQKAILEGWLGTQAPAEAPVPSFTDTIKNEVAGKDLDRGAVIRLIRLMIAKGILSSEEASSIFDEPFI